MLKQTKIAFLVSALIAGAAFANTAAARVVNEPITREAGQTRGEGKGHPAMEVKEQMARNGADDTQPDDRGGRRNSPDSLEQLARNGADDLVGTDEDVGDDHGMNLARNGADDAVDTDEDIGDDHGMDLARNGADDSVDTDEDNGDDHGGAHA